MQGWGDEVFRRKGAWSFGARDFRVQVQGLAAYVFGASGLAGLGVWILEFPSTAQDAGLWCFGIFWSRSCKCWLREMALQGLGLKGFIAELCTKLTRHQP